jgi:hypothetical protein
MAPLPESCPLAESAETQTASRQTAVWNVLIGKIIEGAQYSIHFEVLIWVLVLSMAYVLKEFVIALLLVSVLLMIDRHTLTAWLNIAS